MNTVLPKSITPELIDCGVINKYIVHQDATHEISLLELSPGARIKPHMHKNDSEIYFNITNKSRELCAKGEKHSLANIYDEPIYVISIKFI